VRILWQDGHESIYTGYALRVGCRCALCVDEISGNTRLREESISKDVRPLSSALGEHVGNAAGLRERWGDLSLTRQEQIVAAVLDHVVVAPGRRGFNRFDPSRLAPVWRA